MAVHTLYIIRHGHYLPQPDNENDTGLSELGRAQATMTSLALRYIQPQRIFSSPTRRTVETAEIIAREHKLDVDLNDDLRERLPIIPPHLADHFAQHWPQFTPEVVASDRAIAERAFATFFSPTDVAITDVLVSHGNLIQFLVCKALGAPPENWMNIDTHHTSIAHFQISSTGIKVVAVNESGHLAPHMRTLLNE